MSRCRNGWRPTEAPPDRRLTAEIEMPLAEATAESDVAAEADSAVASNDDGATDSELPATAD